MKTLIAFGITFYGVRVIACLVALFALERWELEEIGVKNKLQAFLFLFMPTYLFYLLGKYINEKFED